MKNLLNSVIKEFSSMTRLQQIILIGFTILPAGILILTFLRYVRQTTVKQMREKILKIYGNRINIMNNIDITEDDIYKDLYK